MQWHRQVDWRPADLAWRVAWLFIAGSLLFAIGSFPLYSQTVPPGVVGITFVIGSVAFTLAAAGQLRQTIIGADSLYERQRTLWWAAIVQLVGTLLFNVNTADAMIEGLNAEETNRLVWAPDFFGSIAFLVASHLGWRCAVGARRSTAVVDGAERWAAGANYVGSVFFMLAAIASFTLSTTGEMVNTAVVNSATCAGALCFLTGSYLLLPPHFPAPARP